MKTLPNRNERESAKPPNEPAWLSREQIKQEIRELDALRLGVIESSLDDMVYHRINELLDMLDNENG